MPCHSVYRRTFLWDEGHGTDTVDLFVLIG